MSDTYISHLLSGLLFCYPEYVCISPVYLSPNIENRGIEGRQVAKSDLSTLETLTLFMLG